MIEWPSVHPCLLGCDNRGKHTEDARSVSILAGSCAGWMKQRQQLAIEYHRASFRLYGTRSGGANLTSGESGVRPAVLEFEGKGLCIGVHF